MKSFLKQKNKGFTLVETMIAVFILTVALVALLGLISTSLFSARYAKNDITANYLIQEVVDYIHSDRDTTAFQQIASGGGWTNFNNRYNSRGCFSANGCEIEPVSGNINACDGTIGGNFGTIPCKVLYYDVNATNKDFYTYLNTSGNLPYSNFKRKVTMSLNSTIPNSDELDIKVTVEWKNGNLVRSRSSTVSLLDWQK